MARLNSFHLEPGRFREPFVLTGPEAAHLLKVLRARAGDRVRLFDGQGREGLFEIAEAGRREARLRPLEIREVPRPSGGLTLALGWNKAGRREALLEKAVELQAAAVLFWKARRSQGDPPEGPKPGWTGAMVQAAKQCGNPWLPDLEVEPGGWEALARRGRDYDRRILLWEGADREARLDPAGLAGPGSCLAVLGPEGGFEDQEARGLLDAGFSPATLGGSVLRWETAALAVLALAFWARGAA